MSLSLKHIKTIDLLIFFLCAFSFALSFSNYVLSVSMFGMMACIFLMDGRNGIKFNKNVIQGFKNVLNDKIKLWSILFYISVIISGLWSSSYSFWNHHIGLLAPFVLFPVLFGFYQKFEFKSVSIIIICGMISMAIQLSLVLINYFQHYEELNYLIQKGKVIPTPISHIRFSLILAAQIIILIYLIIEKKYLLYSWEKWIYTGLFVFFFIGLHILSVKSGVIGLYIGLFCFVFVYLIKIQRLKWIFVFIPGFIFILVAMIYLIPSLQHKYYHFLFQMGEWSRGKLLWHSDIERWQSIQFGTQLISQAPIFGSGIGDFENVVKQIYQDQLPNTEYKLPHNQFIFSWASSGIFSFVCLCSLLYFSLKKAWVNTRLLAFPLLVMIWWSMLVEHSLETEVGIALFFWGLIISWITSKNNS